MIHVLTVHWKDDRWVDIQLAYLRSKVSVPFRVYAYLNYLRRDCRDKFFYSSTEKIRSHAVKLNLLAEVASSRAEGPDDWLLFLDGDAFPVGDIVAYGREKLASYPLVAVRRTENHCDIQPHPSFCLTTVGFWNEIGGDWRAGHCWNNAEGQPVTDVGGNLLSILNAREIAWFAMQRSNKNDLHPLWFGLYDDMVYHHGAGFRPPVSRLDLAHAFGPSAGTGIVRRFLRRVDMKLGWTARRIARRNRALSREVLEWIERDSEFYRRFQESSRS